MTLVLDDLREADWPRAGAGVGERLLRALVERSEGLGIWTLQEGIFAENRAGIALHEKCGFRLVGVRERLGQLRGVWRDVALMERPSQRVGIGNIDGQERVPGGLPCSTRRRTLPPQAVEIQGEPLQSPRALNVRASCGDVHWPLKEG